MVNSTITSNTHELKQTPVWKNASFWHIAALMAAFSVFYYMDVIIDFEGWVNLRYDIFYTVHDLHRAFFLIPVIYAAYAFRIKGIAVTSLLSLLVFLPRALFVSPYPNPLLRALIFIISMIIMGVFLSLLLNNISARKKLEEDLLQAQNDLLSKQAEGKLALNSQRMQALLKLNRMTEATLKEITDFALEEAVSLTQSKIGYLAFVNEDESVLTMHSWSKSAMAACAIDEKPIIYPVVSTGLWGEAIRQRKPIVTNDYAATNPLKKGYPQGHVVLRRHMNIPVFVGTHIVLVAGVGNKDEDYDHGDIEQLTLLMEGLWRLIERKRIAHDLQKSEERYRRITDNMSDFVSEIDPQGIFRYNSPSIRRILGYDPEELIGSCAFDLVHPEDREYVIARYMEGINTLSDRDVDQRYRCKNGTYIWLRSSGHPLYESTGEHIGMIVNSNDITERKLAEEKIHQLNIELEQKVAERTSALHDSQLALLNLVDDLNQSAKKTALATRKLEETNNELKAFSYSVSHDLRAPLRSIDGFSLALMEDYQEKLDDTGKNYLNKIRSATQHMGLLIEDMLKLSRISHAEFQHESIDLSNLVQSIAQTIQHNNPDKDMKMIIQKDIIIKGDRNSMEIALTNLLENAWKFTGKQKQPLIEFGMTLTEDKKVFFIRDNGVGFDMAYANKLFGAFQRLHSTDEFPGTGIGLATVKRIITRHGGQIWAEGEVGKGAAFFFTIPE
jgi:hypothetical protein